MSIGLPVHNGERFLAEAVEALLDQTLADLELIISDNASTDSTERICRAFARRDSRVRYLRQPENRGITANFNTVLESARGRYFKWAAHDDLHDRRYVERCAGVLDADAGTVLAYARAHSIDAAGAIIRPDWGAHAECGHPDPRIRLRACLAPPRDPIPLPIFGVMRTSVVRRTGRMVPCPDFDRALLAELALHGRFTEVPEPLLLQREHGQRSGPRLAADSRSAPRLLSGGASLLPHWRLLVRHLGSVRRAPRSSRQWSLTREVLRWAVASRTLLGGDLLHALTQEPRIGPLLARRLDARATAEWRRRVEATVTHLNGLLPRSARVVLVDDDALGLRNVGGRPVTPLVMVDGASGGPPADDAAATAALNARRQEGATHLVVAWPGRWILDYHRGFAKHLQHRHRLLRMDADLVVYELRSG